MQENFWPFLVFLAGSVGFVIGLFFRNARNENQRELIEDLMRERNERNGTVSVFDVHRQPITKLHRKIPARMRGPIRIDETVRRAS